METSFKENIKKKLNVSTISTLCCIQRKLLKYISLERVTKLFLRLWDASEAQSELLLPNGGNLSYESSQKWLSYQRVLQQLIQAVTKEPRQTSNELQAMLASNKVIVAKHGGGSVMVWGCFAASGPE